MLAGGVKRGAVAGCGGVASGCGPGAAGGVALASEQT